VTSPNRGEGIRTEIVHPRAEVAPVQMSTLIQAREQLGMGSCNLATDPASSWMSFLD